MPGMRVHELAKEFDMTSKELLDRLAEMKIPAKSHASILQDAYVQKVRKNLEPEIKERAGELEESSSPKRRQKRHSARLMKKQSVALRLKLSVRPARQNVRAVRLSRQQSRKKPKQALLQRKRFRILLSRA